MIGEFEKKKIERALYKLDFQDCIDLAKNSKNPFFLFEYASSINWNDGFDIPNEIADNEVCDLGTALSLFWLADGITYLTDEIKRDEYNGEWADFCDKLIARLKNGFYKVGAVSYDPQLGPVEIYKLEKQLVPSIFYMPVVGSAAD